MTNNLAQVASSISQASGSTQQQSGSPSQSLNQSGNQAPQENENIYFCGCGEGTNAKKGIGYKLSSYKAHIKNRHIGIVPYGSSHELNGLPATK